MSAVYLIRALHNGIYSNSVMCGEHGMSVTVCMRLFVGVSDVDADVV